MAQSAITSCVEACRAAALSSHSAAGLITSVRKGAGHDAAKLGEVARLLRSAEALARSAVAALTGMAALARADALDGTKGAAVASTSAGVSKPKRRRKPKKKDAEQDVVPYVDAGRKMDVDAAASVATLPPSASPVVASGSYPAPARLGSAQATSFYPQGSSVCLYGLASRKDLEGTVGVVIAATSPADERVAVRVPSGEQVRVKFANIKMSIFPSGFG